MNRLFLTVIAVALTCCVAQQVAAQEAPPEVRVRYDAAVGEAVAEFAAGHWAEARALFTEAHRLFPSARTLRGLGMAEFELRNYAEARRMLAQALVSQVNPLTAAQRDKTTALLDRTHAFVGLFVVEAPEGTTIVVDGVAAQQDVEGRLVVTSGKHVISASLPSGETQKRQLDVRGGEVGTVVFEAEAAGVGTAQPVTAPGPGRGDMAVGMRQSTGPSAAPIVLMAGGGALVLGSIVTGILASAAEGRLKDGCPEGEDCDRGLKDDQSAANSLATVTDILWITGAVAAGAGLTWVLLEPGETDSNSAGIQRLDVAAGPASLALRGQF